MELDTRFEWNDETVYGEPVAWYYLDDGTSVEICHEEYCLPEEEWFYSLRRHCSEKDFDDDIYHATNGVIEEYAGVADYIYQKLLHYIENAKNNDNREKPVAIKIPPAERKGYWIEDDDPTVKGHCSVCGWESHYCEDDVIGMPFCPNCGAEMRNEK